jgi:hypothetical protein
VALPIVLTLVFAIRSTGVFVSAENLRGILGLLPEVGLISIGVSVLMICDEFDLSVGSMFALMPRMRRADDEFRRAVRSGHAAWTGDRSFRGLRQRLYNFDVQYSQRQN